VTTPDPEPLYTLAEARPLIMRERCETEGHDLHCSFRSHNARGRITVEQWRCARGCGVNVYLSYPPTEVPQ